MRGHRYKRRARLFGLNLETPVVLFEINLFKETIGGVLGFDAMQPELIRDSSLEGFIHALGATARLRGIGGDHFNP